jgi:hypothetical protein
MVVPMPGNSMPFEGEKIENKPIKAVTMPNIKSLPLRSNGIFTTHSIIPGSPVKKIRMLKSKQPVEDVSPFKTKVIIPVKIRINPCKTVKCQLISNFFNAKFLIYPKSI